MVEVVKGENGYRYADIFPYTVRLLSIAHSTQPLEPLPRIFPQSFEDIYSVRDELAAFKLSIGRNLIDQVNYYAYLKTLGSPELAIINKFFDGFMPKENDKRFVIAPDDFPAELPQGVSHQMMWYLDEGLDYSWVANRIADHIIGLKLTTQDFVAYRKPSKNGLFLPGFSRSIDIPHVHLIIRDTNGLPA